MKDQPWYIHHKYDNRQDFIEDGWMNMRWEEETRERPLIFDCFAASDIIYSAYMEGFINWNIYNLAQERIRRTMNGTWMFKKSNRSRVY